MRSMAADFFVVSVDPLSEDGNDRAAVLMQHLLHFPNVGLALGLLCLGARVGEQLIELLVVPVGLVPGGVGSIGASTAF